MSGVMAGTDTSADAVGTAVGSPLGPAVLQPDTPKMASRNPTATNAERLLREVRDMNRR